MSAYSSKIDAVANYMILWDVGLKEFLSQKGGKSFLKFYFPLLAWYIFPSEFSSGNTPKIFKDFIFWLDLLKIFPSRTLNGVVYRISYYEIAF